MSLDFSPSRMGSDVEDFSVTQKAFAIECQKHENQLPWARLAAKSFDAFTVFVNGVMTSTSPWGLLNFKFENKINNILAFAVPTTRAEVITLGAKSAMLQGYFKHAVVNGQLFTDMQPHVFSRQANFVIYKLAEMFCGKNQPVDSKAFLKKQISANDKKINAIENEKKQHRTEAEAAAKIKKQTKNKARRRRRKARAKRNNRPEARPTALKRREIAAQPEWTKRIALDQVLKERGTKTIEVYCFIGAIRSNPNVQLLNRTGTPPTRTNLICYSM